MTIVPASMLEPTAPRHAFMGHDALSWLFLFRLLLVSALILLFAIPAAVPWLGLSADPALARHVLSLQGLLVLVSGLLVLMRRPAPEQQVAMAAFIDILTYTLLMHLSGGPSTGLGLLPAIAVITVALLTEGRLALLFASLATLAVIAQQAYAQLAGIDQAGGYTQAGLLGMTYFAVALLAHVLSRRVREIELLAARRKVDLADLAKLNENVIQSLSIGLIVVDGDRQVLLLNDTARKLLSNPHAETSTPLSNLEPTLANWLQDRLIDGSTRSDVLAIGERELVPSLQLLGDTRASGAVLYLRDNREVKRQAQDIKLASLGRLTASIAHNIRNPLSSVSHAAQLLGESSGLDAEERHLLEIIRRNALRIDETVTSVLALSRRDRAEPQTFDLRDWLGEFCGEYRDSNRIDHAHLRLRVSRDPMQVTADPRHLGQIMRNLCDNAFKHGSKPGTTAVVDITARRDAETGQAMISVADDGPGIPPALVREVFEPFFTTASHGTGLGLHAAREFAEANAMTLNYADGKEPGAQFRLSFPS